jgi:putative ABC transport system permease protein
MTVRYAKKTELLQNGILKICEYQTLFLNLYSIGLHTKTSGLIEENGNFLFLMIMVGLSVLILLLSIVNYINYATANAIKRALKRVGVRKVGFFKINIIQQFVLKQQYYRCSQFSCTCGTVVTLL